MMQINNQMMNAKNFEVEARFDAAARGGSTSASVIVPEAKPTPQPEVAAASGAEDTVTLSEEAKQTLEIKKPYYDWESRTIRGKPMPDNYYKELTPEMLSGEQPYRKVITLSGDGAYYEAVDYTPQEYTLSNLMDRVDAHDARLQKYDAFAARLNQSNSGGAMGMGLLQAQKESENQGLATYLKTTVQGLGQLGLTIEKAHDMLFEISDGRLDLTRLLQKYL